MPPINCIRCTNWLINTVINAVKCTLLPMWSIGAGERYLKPEKFYGGLKKIRFLEIHWPPRLISVHSLMTAVMELPGRVVLSITGKK